ncbi:MAG: undecaprenyl-diphosphate phosphatase [Pseudomonadota bacterium]
MNLVTSVILGIIQGLTEFLPISSSGHLVFFQNLLGIKEPELLFDISLHLGTLVAICLYFRSDLKMMITETWRFTLHVVQGRERITQVHDRPHAALTLWVLVGTFPTALIGVAFKPIIEELFGSVTIVGFMMVVTGLIIGITRLIPKDYNKRNDVGLWTAVAIGIVQGIAIIPGISRSGSTIVCGMVCKLRKDLAARFSFLLSIPAVFGAMVLQFGTEGFEKINPLMLITGFITSTLVGLLALKIFMGMVRRGNLAYFAPYCWAMGLVILFL